jgi:hypothetical protein
LIRHDISDVSEKIQKATRSYVERGLARILDDVELRIAMQLANAGKPQLAVERLSLAILDLEARADDLENVKQVRPATPEQYAKMAAEWETVFPGSEPPSQWSISRLDVGRK